MEDEITFATLEEQFRRKAAEVAANPPRKHSANEEHKIQCACVRWFRTQYPHLKNLLFAIPNGGFRTEAVGAKMKAEGVLAGVLDLLLLIPRRECGALFLECKTPKGRLSDKQKEFIEAATQQGYICVVFRSITEFISIIQNYLAGDLDKIKRL